LVALDVVSGDAAVLAGGRDATDLDAHLASELAGGGRGEDAFARGGDVDDLDLLGGRGGRGLDRCGWRRRVAVWLRRRRGRRVAVVDDDEDLADRDDVAVLVVDLGDRAGARGGELDGGLIGHHLDEGLVELDGVTDLDLPTDDLALDNTFADIGHVEVERHGYHSRV
jgi:hypothetical protein